MKKRTRKRFEAAVAVFAGLALLVGAAWGAYVNNGDGTVTDTATGLVWQQADDAQMRTWQNALSYCEALDLVGRSDWRLPDIRELVSIVDYGRHSPAINPTFNCQISPYPYWSGSTVARYPDLAWYMNFSIGFAFDNGKSNSAYVRCVRGGPSGGHLNITEPDGGEILIKGQNYTTTWDSQNVSGPIQIDLYKGPISAPQLFRPIAAAAPNTGNYQFTPSLDIPNGSDYLIRISAQSGSLQDFSRGLFTITDTPPRTANPTPWNQLLLLNE